MKLAKSLFVVALVASVSACGTKNNSEQPVAADVKAAAIPAGTIVRVPVDASGNPIGEPTMRTIAADKSIVSDAAALQAAFDKGQEPEKIVKSKDELNGDSSTQSWCGWGLGGLGYGYGYGYYGGYGLGYWSGAYSPILWWGGASYGYGYGGFGGLGGYNYYGYWR